MGNEVHCRQHTEKRDLNVGLISPSLIKSKAKSVIAWVV